MTHTNKYTNIISTCTVEPLYKTDRLVQELLSVIWRCPLLGGFIIIMFKKAFSTKMLRSEVMAVIAFRPTMVSTGTGAAGFILMTELSKLVEKAIGRPNTNRNSVKSELFPSLCLCMRGTLGCTSQTQLPHLAQ